MNTKLLLVSLIAIALPSVVILGGGWLMKEVSGRNAVNQSDLPRPLQSRLMGYAVADVTEYWKKLYQDGRLAERRLLQFDLLFALLYSSALGFSLWLVWTKFYPVASPIWVLIPVIVLLLADWIETAVLLHHLNRFIDTGTDVMAVPIAVASVATSAKWVSAGLSVITLLILVALAIFSRAHDSA